MINWLSDVMVDRKIHEGNAKMCRKIQFQSGARAHEKAKKGKRWRRWWDDGRLLAARAGMAQLE